MRSVKTLWRVALLVAVLAVGLAAGCGEEPPEQGAQGNGAQENGAQESAPQDASATTTDMETAGGATEETTGGTTGDTTEGGTTGGTTGGTVGSGQENVAASYAIAQEEIEAEGGEKLVDDYRVGYIVEPAEGWWEGEAQNLEWREPASGETNHIEILPYDAQTGLLVPYMDISLAVLDESGQTVQEQELNYYWSEFVHYSNNFSLPESGTYTLRAELGVPDFLRHGSEDGEGRVFTEPVTVEFENVEIDTEGE